ncbi:MAG: hypothetical protein WCO84_04855 [bacterium]
MKNLKYLLILVALVSFNIASAVWTAPTATPPGNNTQPPINIGAGDQSKIGKISASDFCINDDPSKCLKNVGGGGGGGPNSVMMSTPKGASYLTKWQSDANNNIINSLLYESSGKLYLGSSGISKWSDINTDTLDSVSKRKDSFGVSGVTEQGVSVGGLLVAVKPGDAGGSAIIQGSLGVGLYGYGTIPLPLSKLSILGSGTPHLLAGSDLSGDVLIEGSNTVMGYAGNQTNLSIFTTDSQSVDRGASIGLGARHSTDVSSVFSIIKAGKDNSTAGQNGGYLSFGTRTNGANVTERIRITSNGNVGIGTISPNAKLEVVGSVKITDGTQGDGKILVSDANGNASWKVVATGSGTVGPAGPIGPQGPAGPTSATGAKGLDGAKGATGPIGPQGPAGPTGATGLDGAKGATGPIGPQGIQGVQGPVGPTGPAGAPAAKTVAVCASAGAGNDASCSCYGAMITQIWSYPSCTVTSDTGSCTGYGTQVGAGTYPTYRRAACCVCK